MPASEASLKLSVLIPVYNSGNLLEKCLRSLAAQDARSIEFICINDGSTDGSDAVLNTWAAQDARFRVIHQANGGYGKAMNKGLEAARGAWVGIVEPDDHVEPTMFSHLLALADSTSAPIVKGNYSGERNGNSRPADKFTDLPDGTVLPAQEALDYLSGNVSIWSAIYRRDWLVQHGIRFSETPGAAYQDLGFAIRTWIIADSICITPMSAYHYKEDNPASSTRKLDKGAWECLHELELQADIFSVLPETDTTRRSLLVRRILHSLQTDYRRRLTERIPEYLAAYSALLNRSFPLHTLDASVFKKREWHDLQLLYNAPQQYPNRRKGNISWLQRLYSCRKEAGHHVLRLLGLTFHLPR